MAKELTKDGVDLQAALEDALAVAQEIEAGIVAGIQATNIEEQQAKNVQSVLADYGLAGVDVTFPLDGIADNPTLLDQVKKLMEERKEQGQSYGQLGVVNPSPDGRGIMVLDASGRQVEVAKLSEINEIRRGDEGLDETYHSAEMDLLKTAVGIDTDKDDAAKKKAEEEAKKKAEEEAKRRAEEARVRAEEDARLRAEEEERLRIEEEARLKAEEEARIAREEEALLMRQQREALIKEGHAPSKVNELMDEWGRQKEEALFKEQLQEEGISGDDLDERVKEWNKERFEAKARDKDAIAAERLSEREKFVYDQDSKTQTVTMGNPLMLAAFKEEQELYARRVEEAVYRKELETEMFDPERIEALMADWNQERDGKWESPVKDRGEEKEMPEQAVELTQVRLQIDVAADVAGVEPEADSIVQKAKASGVKEGGHDGPAAMSSQMQQQNDAARVAG